MRKLLIIFLILLIPSLASAMTMGSGFKVKHAGDVKYWGNNCMEKVWRNDMRVTDGKLTKDDGEYYTGDVNNLVWNHNTQSFTFYTGANMTRSACIFVEAPNAIDNITISTDNLTPTSGTFAITGSFRANDDTLLSDYRDRDIITYWARYREKEILYAYSAPNELEKLPSDPVNPDTAPIEDISYNAESSVFSVHNLDVGFKQRPQAYEWLPEPLIPIEAQMEFTGTTATDSYKTRVPAQTSQMILIDYYIPRDLPADTYTGDITITTDGVAKVIPMTMIVKNHVMSDTDKIAWQGWFQQSWLREYEFPEVASWGDASEDDLYEACDNGHKLLARDRWRQSGHTAENPSDMESICNYREALTGAKLTTAENYEGPYLNTPMKHFLLVPFGLWYTGSPLDEVDFQAPCSYPIAAYTTQASDYVDSWATYIANTLPNLEQVTLYLIDEYGNDASESDDWECISEGIDVLYDEGWRTVGGATGKVLNTIGNRWIMGYAGSWGQEATNLDIGIPCFYSANSTDDGQCPNIDEEYLASSTYREFIPYNIGHSDSIRAIDLVKRTTTHVLDTTTSRVNFMFQYQLNHWAWTYDNGNGAMFDPYDTSANWGKNFDQAKGFTEPGSYWNGYFYGRAQRTDDGTLLYPARARFNAERRNDYGLKGYFPGYRLKLIRMGVEMTNLIDHVYNLDAGGASLVNGSYTAFQASDDPDVAEQFIIDLLNYIDP